MKQVQMKPGVLRNDSTFACFRHPCCIIAQFKALELYGMAARDTELQSRNIPEVCTSLGLSDNQISCYANGSKQNFPSAASPLAIIKPKLLDFLCSEIYKKQARKEIQCSKNV
jgi:hypothetical protein